MTTKRGTRNRNGVASRMDQEDEKDVGSVSHSQASTSGSQSEQGAAYLRRSSRTRVGTSGDAAAEEETRTFQNRSSNVKESGSNVTSRNEEKSRNDLMPDEIMAIFSNRGAGKRQPKIMTSVVLPSMIRMSGDIEDDDEDFHVQEEELEVESDSSDGPEGNDDQRDDAKDFNESSDESVSTDGENDEAPRRKRRKVSKSITTNHNSCENSSDDESSRKNDDSDEDQSSDDDLTLVQTLDKFGRQAEQDENRANHLICAVCMLTEGELDDYIVQCDKCGISVHEGCYGDPASGLDTDTQSESSDGSETEPWFCASCLCGLSAPPDCELCPSVGGIYRQTDDNNWIHIVCGLYIHQVSYGELERLENVCLQSVPSQLWGAKICAFCDDTRFARSGIALQCDAGLCKTYYHASCGQKMGFLAEAELREDGAAKTIDTAESPSLSFNFYSYCKLHSDPDIVRQRQRTYNLLQKQVTNFQSAITGKVQKYFEKQSLKYMESRKLVEAWYPDPPVPRLISTRPALAKQLTRKAEMLGKLCDGVPTEFTVNISSKWHIQPAFNVNFVAYFQDRERRYKDLQRSIVKNVRCNDHLKVELAILEKKLRKITYIVDNMQKMIDKRVNQMIDTTSHLRSLTNLEYTLPITCTATLDLISKQPTAKKSSATVKSKEEYVPGESGAAKGKDGSVVGTAIEKSADKAADDDNLFIVLNKCEICKLRNNQHLIIECDSCKLHFHINCLDPPLSRVPKKGEKWLWQCKLCCPDTTKVEVFEDNLPRKRKKTVVYGREEKTQNEKDEDLPRKEAPLELESRVNEKERNPEKPMEPERGVMGQISERLKSEDLPFIKKPSQILSKKTPPHPTTKKHLEVFEFECSDTENENPSKCQDDKSQLAFELNESADEDENTLRSSSLPEVNVVTSKSEEILRIESSFKARTIDLKKITTVDSDQVTTIEIVSKPRVPETKAVVDYNVNLQVVQDESVLQAHLKEKEIEETPIANEIGLENTLENKPIERNVIALTAELKSSAKEMSNEPRQNESGDKIETDQSEIFMDEGLSENKKNQEMKVPDVLPEPKHISTSSSSSGSISSSSTDTYDFSRLQHDKQGDGESSSDSSSSSTDDSFETVDPLPTAVDVAANQIIGEVSINIDTGAREQEQQSIRTSAGSQDQNSATSSSTSESGSIRAESNVGEIPLKTRSASSDDTIVFGGLDKNEKTSDISGSNYSDVCRKITKDLQTVQKQLKENEQHLDSIKESSRHMNEEESSEANLSNLPKSSPQDFIAKWAKESGHSFTFDSSTKSSIITDSDSGQEIFKNLEASRGTGEVMAIKVDQSAGKEKFYDCSYGKVTPAEKVDEKSGLQDGRTTKPSAVADKVTDSTVEIVQYREITKISPEGEPIIVRVPIRKKLAPASQREPKKPEVFTSAPISSPEPKKSVIATSKFKDPVIRLDNLNDTVPLSSPTGSNTISVGKETKFLAQCIPTVMKQQDPAPKTVISGSSHVKSSFLAENKDPLELFVPVRKPEKPSSSLFIKDKAEELERKKKRKIENISTSPNKAPFSTEKPQAVITKQSNENRKAKNPALCTPDFDQREDSDSLKEELYSSVVPAVINKLSVNLPFDRPIDVKKSNLASEIVTTQHIRPTGAVKSENTKQKRLIYSSEEILQDVHETKESGSQSGKCLIEIEVDNKGKSSDKTSKVQDLEKPSKAESAGIAVESSMGVSLVSAPKQTKMSKVQLIDDLFGDFDSSGPTYNATSIGNSKNMKQSKKVPQQQKSDHDKKASAENEKTFRKVESSSYMPRFKVSKIVRNEDETESSKKSEEKIETSHKDATVKAADVSEQNIATKRPSVQHFKIPKTKKTALKEPAVSKQEVIKEYGGVRCVESQRTKIKEAVTAAKPKDTGHRRIFGTNEPKKPARQFPPAREFMKPRNPMDIQPSGKAPTDEGQISPTFPTAPLKIPVPASDKSFKEKLGQLLELGGTIVDDSAPVSAKFDDEEYDPTSNYKVDVANKKRKLSSSSVSNLKPVPAPNLPVPLPPPTGFSFEDFDYDNPPPPPPGLIGFDNVQNSKSKFPVPSSGIESPAKPSSTGIPPPIVMIPPGRAAREGVRRAPSHEPIHVHERVFPMSPSEMYPRPSQSTPQPKRKKDFREYLQENRTKSHPHAATAMTCSNSAGHNFPPGVNPYRRQESPPGHINDEVFQVEDAGTFDESTERKSSENNSRPGTPVLDESTDPLIIRSTDPNDPVVNPSEIPLSPNATVRIMQMLIDSNMIPGSSKS